MRALLLALAATTAVTGAARACEPGDASHAGHYVLNGVMEVGSEILIQPNGSFEFALAYGANDQYGKGCWVKTGQTIALIPEGQTRVTGRHTPESFGFTGITLSIDGKALVWNIGNSGKTGRFER